MYITGLNPDRRTDAAEFALGGLGFIATEEGAKGYIYVQASGAITANNAAQIEAGFQADMVDSAGQTEGSAIGIASTAFADDEYGWLQVFGLAEGRAGASTTAGASLQLDATADGRLIPATVDTPQILGLICVDVLADNGVGTVQLNWPVIRA